MKTHRNLIQSSLAFATLCLCCLQIQAQVTFVNDAAALAANDSIDWAHTGASGYAYGWSYGTTVPVSFGVDSTLGLGITVYSTNLSRVDQNNGWNGHFTSGTPLLWNHNPYSISSGGITTSGTEGGDVVHIHFAAPVSGAGAQIEANPGSPFTYVIRAYDSNSNSIGSSAGAGPANGNATAFIGLASISNNISEIVFGAVANGTSRRNFAIGPVLINDTNYVPTITSQPQSVVVNVHTNVTFMVGVADSITSLNYQWIFNGSPLAGATNSALTITNSSPQNQGKYQVRVSNTFGSVTSIVVMLWLAPLPPATLGIVLVGNQPVLFWQASVTNYVLQTTTNLTSVNWSTVNNDNSGMVIITNATGNAFFRLQ